MSKREQIVNSLCDLKGYRPDDLDGYSIKEMLEPLTKKETKELREYSGIKV